LERRRFGTHVSSPAEAAQAQAVLRLLLVQGGSTTRLCEAIAGSEISLHVIGQRQRTDAPQPVLAALSGECFVERFSCLASRGVVMLDSLAYIATRSLPRDLEQDIEAGAKPIGHLLERLWTRRALWPEAHEALCARLWARVGCPDATASRTYTVATPDGPLMVITETFRDGMLMSPPRAAPPRR
jgi:chorismate-pyruvate lyase